MRIYVYIYIYTLKRCRHARIYYYYYDDGQDEGQEQEWEDPGRGKGSERNSRGYENSRGRKVFGEPSGFSVRDSKTVCRRRAHNSTRARA